MPMANYGCASRNVACARAALLCGMEGRSAPRLSASRQLTDKEARSGWRSAMASLLQRANQSRRPNH